MPISERILLTLKWFSLQQTPLTLLELWRFLVRDPKELLASLNASGDLSATVVLEDRRVASGEVLGVLNRLLETKQVGFAFGYYFLAGQEEMARRRWLSYDLGILREKLIKKYINFLGRLAFIDGVALVGSQAMGLQKAASDIDLLIITRPGWLWLPRTLVTAYFQLLGLRRYGNHIANRFCLNHYLSGPKPVGLGLTWYTAGEYGKLIPLVGRAAVFKFLAANRNWIMGYFPNLKFASAGFAVEPSKLIDRLLDNGLGRWLEKVLEQLQKPRIRTEEKNVIVESDELSFHPNSKQDALLREFSELH
jgi:predicted nucleotidyltransferase